MDKKQRKSDRYPVEFPVEFRNKKGVINAQVENIGNGGMCIRTADVLPVNSKGFFRIISKDNPVHFNVEGEVMWSQPQSRIRQRRNKRPGMMGIRFVKSRFFTEETIAGLIANVGPTA